MQLSSLNIVLDVVNENGVFPGYIELIVGHLKNLSAGFNALNTRRKNPIRKILKKVMRTF